MAGDVGRFPLIVLCGGKSGRMGVPKGLVRTDGEYWIERQLALFSKISGSRVIVVLGYDADRYFEALPWLRQDSPHTFVINDAPEHGPFSSIVSAGRILTEPAAFLLPIDVPVPSAEVCKALTGAFSIRVQSCVPVFKKKGGHPVLLAATFLKQLAQVPFGSSEARLDEQIRRLQEDQRVRVPVDDPRILWNANTPAEMARLAAE
ncbi:MAG: NTP transferase domain-containing protein [Pseudomonadota bacterium]